MPSRSRKNGKRPKAGEPLKSGVATPPPIKATHKAKPVKATPTTYDTLYCDACGGLSFSTPQCVYCGPLSRGLAVPLGEDKCPPTILRECFDLLDKARLAGPGVRAWTGSAPFLAWNSVDAKPGSYTLYFYPTKTGDKSTANSHEWFICVSEEDDSEWDVYHIEHRAPKVETGKTETVEWYVDTIVSAEDLIDVLEEMAGQMTPAQEALLEQRAKAKAERSAARKKAS